MLLARWGREDRCSLLSVLAGEVQGGSVRLHRTGPRQHHTECRATVGRHRRNQQQPVGGRFRRRALQRKVRATDAKLYFFAH